MGDKEKYIDFIDRVCEMLGLGRPIDILRLCKAVDEYIEPFEAHIRAAECRLAEYEKEVKELKAKVEGMKFCDNCKHSYTWGGGQHYELSKDEFCEQCRLCKNISKGEA